MSSPRLRLHSGKRSRGAAGKSIAPAEMLHGVCRHGLRDIDIDPAAAQVSGLAVPGAAERVGRARPSRVGAAVPDDRVGPVRIRDHATAKGRDTGLALNPLGIFDPAKVERAEAKTNNLWLESTAGRRGVAMRHQYYGILPRADILAIAGVGIAICLIFLIITVWAVRERTRTISDDGYRTGANLAHVLKEQTTRSIQAVDLTLSAIANLLQQSALAEHDPGFEDALRRMLPTLPSVRALFVIGADGFITQDTDHPFTPRVSLADRAYFRAHLDSPHLGLHIGAPLLSRSTGTWFVSLSRRIDRADGSFGGIVVAAVEVRQFESFYAELELSPKDGIALFLRDGPLLLRAPHIEAFMGQSLAGSQLFQVHLKKGPIGSFRSNSLFDDVARIINYRALDQYPIVVTVALAEETILATWRRNVVGAYAVGLLLAAVLTVLTLVYVRYRRRYQRAHERQLQAQRLEALGRMTGGIAHDFTNLLGVITTSIYLARRAIGIDRSESERLLGQIAEAADQGKVLTSRLLSFAKRRELDIRSVNANARLAKMEPLLRQAAGSKVGLKLSPEAGVWPCSADPAQFDSALLNLVINGRDAMPRGGRLELRTGNIRIAGHSDYDIPAGDYVEVTVIDNGTGMSSDIRRQALEPFFSTKRGGTGLGLSQVYGFVQQVGGDLRIESKIGAGTSVHLLFRRATSQAPDDPTLFRRSDHGPGHCKNLD